MYNSSVFNLNCSKKKNQADEVPSHPVKKDHAVNQILALNAWLLALDIKRAYKNILEQGLRRVISLHWNTASPNTEL